MTRRFGCCCAWACKEAGLSIAAIDTIAVAPINCAQLSLFPAVWLSLSIVSTWHLRLLVAIDPLVVVMNVAAPSVCGWIEKKLLAGASWGTVYQNAQNRNQHFRWGRLQKALVLFALRWIARPVAWEIPVALTSASGTLQTKQMGRGDFGFGPKADALPLGWHKVGYVPRVIESRVSMRAGGDVHFTLKRMHGAPTAAAGRGGLYWWRPRQE